MLPDDKLEWLRRRYHELTDMLCQPDVTNDGARFTSLSRERADMEPLITAYERYLEIKRQIADVMQSVYEQDYVTVEAVEGDKTAQFVGKDVRDPFRVGRDIDAVSRASISITSAARAVRNGGRRLARELLSPPPVAK